MGKGTEEKKEKEWDNLLHIRTTGRGVNTCNYIVGRGAIETMERGFRADGNHGRGM